MNAVFGKGVFGSILFETGMISTTICITFITTPSSMDIVSTPYNGLIRHTRNIASKCMAILTGVVLSWMVFIKISSMMNEYGVGMAHPT